MNRARDHRLDDPGVFEIETPGSVFDECDAELSAILVKLRALPDRKMRAHRLVDELLARPCEHSAQIIDALASTAARTHQEISISAQALYLAINLNLLPYAACAQYYAYAKEHKLETCKELLLTVVLGDPDGPSEFPSAAIPRGNPRGRNNERTLTTGERKALARGSARQKLIELLRDPHPHVISILLDNPRLFESDIVRVSAGDQTPPATLVRIAEHPRWSSYASVRLALLCNTRLPTATGLRLATLVTRPEAKQAHETPHLSEAIALSLARRFGF
jgi:hypothetical protein